MVEVLEEAEQELTEAADYYEKVDPRVRVRFLAEFERVVSLLEDHPYIGSLWEQWEHEFESRRVRRISFKSFPYRSVYVLIDELPVIVAVAHMRRRPGYWAERLRQLR